jgi:hypothetical protein
MQLHSYTLGDQHREEFIDIVLLVHHNIFDERTRNKLHLS